MRTLMWHAAAVLGAGSACIAQPQTFQFTLNPAASGMSGTLNASVDTSGTLKGNWDAAANPTGTRTKPGLFGTFGPTENVPVPTLLSGDVGGPIDTEGSGGLRLRIDPGALTCRLSGLAVDFIGKAPVAVPGSGTIDFDSFRTRSPDSTYPGLPVSLPLGDVLVTELNAAQIGPAFGTVQAGIPGVFTFAVNAGVNVSGSIDVLGSVVELPPTPLILAFQGTITLTPGGATLVSSQPVTLVQNQQPKEPLPEFPLDIPTVLPAGGTAHLLMNLVVDAIAFNLDASLDLAGDGVPACYADCNGDNTLTIADFACFQAVFAASDPYADCNGSGTLSIADFGCFQNAFVGGCP